MTQINPEAPVLVTGATGYIASWLVKKLLEAGKTVHAAVRHPEDPNSIKHLVEMAACLPGQLIFFKADLLKEGSYEAAMRDCELVYHLASPCFADADDIEIDLIKPALHGTANVLNQVNKTTSVKRMVLTSSVGAIYGDAIELQELMDQQVNEALWNHTSSESHLPFAYSKTIAEKCAWEYEGKQNRWDLLVINPSLVVGPAINALAQSNHFIVKLFGSGAMRLGCPKYPLGLVDVEDVATAHFNAGFISTASGRYIVSWNQGFDLYEMGQILRQHFGGAYPFPPFPSPKFLSWLIAPLLNKHLTRRMVTDNIHYQVNFDHNKSIYDLGLTYHDPAQALIKQFEQMIRSGAFDES